MAFLLNARTCWSNEIMNMETGNRLKRVRRIVASLLTFGYLSLALMPAYASDTEVYARKLTVTGELAPTLMMVVDTSGSMNECVSTSSSCSYPNRRIDALKSAFHKILYGSAADAVSEVPGYVKMGLTRFNPDANKGGWVRYPARPLDAFVDINPNGVINSPISNGNQDTEAPVSGTEVINSTELDIAVENSNNKNQSIGLQFKDLLVPKNATIASAYVEFTANANDSGTVPVWQLAAENTDNATDFATTPMSSRTYLASAITYRPTDWVQNQVYQVPVDSLVQEIVNRAGWCGGNALSLSIHDISGLSGVWRRAYSYEGAVAAGNVARAPKLVVTYTIDPKSTNSCIVAPFSTQVEIPSNLSDVEWKEGATGSVMTTNSNNLSIAKVLTGNKRNQVGLHFTGVKAQKNATVTAATLYLTGYANVNSVPSIEVAAFNQGNIPAFCSSSSSCSIPDQSTLTTASIWAPPSNKIVSNDKYALDVTSIVQSVLNNSGWASNNAMGFRLRSTETTTAASNNGSFYARDAGQASKYPTLLIKGTQRYTDLSQLRTVRDDLWSVIDGITADGGTPLGAAYAEAARYMLGVEPYAVLYDPLVVTSTTPTKYVSPVSTGSECSGNYLFMMSDGDPNTLANVNVNTQGFMGTSACPSSLSSYVTGTASQLNWICMYDVARYMVGGANQIKTKVKTNTAIFGPLAGDSEANMKMVATFGKGEYFKAGDEAALVKAVDKTVQSLLDVSGSISAPGVAVNQLSRLNHLDQLYYSVFDPDVNKASWKGNVKRYRLGFQTVAGATEAVIYDKNNVDAVDPTTSFFKSTAWSEWSPAQDGDRAMLGGAASVLPAPDNRDGGTPRKMYTYVGAYASTPASAVSLQPIDLADASFNTSAKSVMAITDDNIYRNLINWLKGYDITDFNNGLVAVDNTTRIRLEMGGALHSRPVLVNYGYASGSTPDAAAADASLQDNMAYYSTMEGVFHGIDTKTGKEVFSFIPKEMLQRLNVVATNPTQSLPEFGLDLTWTVLREDKDGDFRITTGSSGDRVWLFGGMRMGGSNYYALDLTDRSSPKLKWALVGGTSGAFQNMGETWSQPVLGSVKINNVLKKVLFFGGGYDPKHETAGYTAANASDSRGNQVYIVDADTGQLYWWASSSGSPSLSVPDLKFSIPSELKVVDANSDGLADAVYFGDMGGQVFRLDLNNANTSAAGLGVRVRLLASLGQTVTADVANQRRFFDAPSVARFRDPTNSQIYYLVALGSGYRSHPLDEATNDFFYVLRDNDVVRSDLLTATTFQSTLTLADLIAVDPSTVTSTGVNMTGRMGWYVDLPDNGEKVMASPFIFNNEVFFTSYVPTVVGGSSCTPVVGRTKLYQMGVLNGALVDSNNDGVVDASDSAVTDNVVFGLGGEAQLVIPAPDTSGLSPACGSVILVGTRPICGDNLTQGSFKRLRWYNKSSN